MNAGNLNCKIAIQESITAYDTYNSPVQSWRTKAVAWAEVLNSGGGEFYAAQKINAQTTTVFKIRYRENITSRDRVKYKGRYFDILSAEDAKGKRISLIISAKEVV